MNSGATVLLMPNDLHNFREAIIWLHVTPVCGAIERYSCSLGTWSVGSLQDPHVRSTWKETPQRRIRDIRARHHIHEQALANRQDGEVMRGTRCLKQLRSASINLASCINAPSSTRDATYSRFTFRTIHGNTLIYRNWFFELSKVQRHLMSRPRLLYLISRKIH